LKEQGITSYHKNVSKQGKGSTTKQEGIYQIQAENTNVSDVAW
jgi:hypothetical protein